jgi:hypothetical protein
MEAEGTLQHSEKATTAPVFYTEPDGIKSAASRILTLFSHLHPGLQSGLLPQQ